MQGEAERNKERNENEQQVLLKQKEVTTNLKQDHIKITTDIKVAQSRIEDLTNRRSMLRDQIADILKQKRKVDKRNYELEEAISGRNITEDDAREMYKEEERKMRIEKEE